MRSQSKFSPIVPDGIRDRGRFRLESGRSLTILNRDHAKKKHYAFIFVAYMHANLSGFQHDRD